MSNVRSVLSVVILCSIVSGSVFLEGMELLRLLYEKKNKSKEVKQVKVSLRNSRVRPAYACIKGDYRSDYYSIESLIKKHGYKIRENDLFLYFWVLDAEPYPAPTLYGKEATKNIHHVLNKLFPLESCLFDRVVVPVKKLLNPDGTFKGENDIVKVQMIEEDYDIELILTDKGKKFYDRIELCKKHPKYYDDNKKALLEKEILAIGPDKKKQHGPKGFDFSQIKFPEGFCFGKIKFNKGFYGSQIEIIYCGDGNNYSN